MIILDSKEREKFALWCEQQASSDEAMAQQMGVSLSASTGAALLKKFRAEAMAKRIVAQVLLSIESDSVVR